MTECIKTTIFLLLKMGKYFLTQIYGFISFFKMDSYNNTYLEYK